MLHILYSLIGLVRTLLEVFPTADTALAAADQMAADYIKSKHDVNVDDVVEKLPSKAGFYRRRQANGCEVVKVEEVVDRGWVRNALLYRETVLASFIMEESHVAGVVLQSAHEAEVSTLAAAVAAQRDEIATQTERISQLSDKNTATHRQLQMACDQNALLMRSQKTIQDAVQTLRDENVSLQQTVSQDRTEGTETIHLLNRCTGEITALRQQMDELTRKCNMLQTQYEAERFLTCKLEDEIIDLHQDNTSLSEQVTTLLNTNTQLYENMRRMECSLSRANNDTARDCAVISDYADQVKTFSSDVSDLREHNAALADVIDKNDAVFNALSREYVVLRDAGANTLAENAALRTANDNTLAENAALRAQNQTMADECNALTEQNVALTRAKNELSCKCDELHDERANDALELAECRERLGIANDKIEELADECSALRTEVASLKSENRRRAAMLANSTRMEEVRIPIRGVTQSHIVAPRPIKRPGWSQVVDELKNRFIRAEPRRAQAFDDDAIDTLLKELNTNLESLD